MTPPPLLSGHAKHGKFAEQISSAEMPNCDKPMAVPHCPHGVDFGEIWRGYHRGYAYQAAKR
ncbi:MAG: hypothetical protein KKD35_04430, partial [Elusimicrobia bacterium]|nr:hypothetical protein [Elusimicrobiota bacterium]